MRVSPAPGKTLDASLMPALVACHAPLHLPLVGRVAPRSLHHSTVYQYHYYVLSYVRVCEAVMPSVAVISCSHDTTMSGARRRWRDVQPASGPSILPALVLRGRWGSRRRQATGCASRPRRPGHYVSGHQLPHHRLTPGTIPPALVTQGSVGYMPGRARPLPHLSRRAAASTLYLCYGRDLEWPQRPRGTCRGRRLVSTAPVFKCTRPPGCAAVGTPKQPRRI